MTLRAIEPAELLESLFLDEGPFLSMFLPYGSPGLNDDRMRIDHKNIFVDAKKKLEKATDEHWQQLLTSIESKSEKVTRDGSHKMPPCTDVYIR